MTGSSKNRSTLTVGTRSYDYWSFANLPAGQGRAAAVFAEDPAGEPAALRRRRQRHARRHRRGAQLGRQGHALLRNRLHAGARDHAGLHRRALRGGPGRHARGRAETRWRSAADQSAESRGAGHRSLGAGGRLRQRASSLATNNKIEFERNGERYAFLRWGQTAFRNFKVVPPNTGIVHQVNLEYLGRVVFHNDTDGQEPGLSRHRGRHRLAHHDDQWPGRARLGRRRHRSRGRDARPARDHAHSAGHRLQD